MSIYLPGVDAAYVRDRMSKAGGNEIDSGKFASPESSAALAVNCFAWFHERPNLLPAFPSVTATYPATSVDVEFEARLPWPAGKHPWLDAFVVTPSHIIGVESKRHEPFRDKKKIELSEAYDRPVWGQRMTLYEKMRDMLRSGEVRYRHLDAAQLVKHAFGLVTQARREERPAILLYLYAEPASLHARPLAKEVIELHRNEARDFAARVLGDEVEFHHLSYRDWIESWRHDGADVRDHGARVLETFQP